MTDKYVKLNTLPQKEKDELIDMSYKYKDTISLRDEIDTCPEIEVEIGG